MDIVFPSTSPIVKIQNDDLLDKDMNFLMLIGKDMSLIGKDMSLIGAEHRIPHVNRQIYRF